MVLKVMYCKTYNSGEISVLYAIHAICLTRSTSEKNKKLNCFKKRNNITSTYV